MIHDIPVLAEAHDYVLALDQHMILSYGHFREVDTMTTTEKFSSIEIAALKSDILQASGLDFLQIAALIREFLVSRGYGVSPDTAFEAVSLIEKSRYDATTIHKVVEDIALVM